MEKPILDPPVPYVGPIYGGRFSPGKMVRVQGIAPAVAYRFNINLQCGPEIVPRDDIAIQVSVRILDGYILVNSLQNGIWGEEQRGAALPIKRAEKFEIILMCDFNQFKVAINGQHYCEFPQRIHYDRITHLGIDGDVSITQISYESGSAGGMAASGSGSGGANISVPPVVNDTDDFELINTNATSAPPPGLHTAPPPGFSQLPSYEAAVHSNQGPFNVPSIGAPYPISAPYPTAVPYPTKAAPYPTVGAPYPGAGMPLYNANGAVGTPYPTGVPGVMGASHFPPPGAPGIPLPPPGAPVPLNAASSNFRPVERSSWKRGCASCCGIFIIVIIIIAVLIAKSRRHSTYHSHRSNSYDTSSYDNYGSNYNNYGSNNNNYGGYNNNNNW